MFQTDNLEKLRDEYNQVRREYDDLLLTYGALHLENPEAQDYKNQGFLRRIKILKRCIQNVYTIYPPETTDRPSEDERTDLSINIQSFIFNIFGYLDNLAWIWVKEKGFQYKKGTEISLSNKKILHGLSHCREYLESDKHKKWLSNLKGFRHALAHRIPPYIPPYSLTPDEEDLGSFIPVITHSFRENAPLILFHAQLLADWHTIIKISSLFLEDLKAEG